MATYQVVKAKHATLSGTTADRVDLLQWFDYVEVSNRGTVALYISWDAAAVPTSGADNTDIVEAGVTKIFPAFQNGGTPAPGTAVITVNLVGNGNSYSVIGV